MSSPEPLINLGQAVLRKHTADGNSSPLNKDKMAKLAAALAIAVPQNQAAKDADAAAQKARQLRDEALGMAAGQTAYSKDTAINLITYARDLLLAEFEGQEESLSGYGFSVVVGSAKSPKPAAPKTK